MTLARPLIDDQTIGEVSRSFLGVEQSACGRQWIDRLDAAGRQTALAIAQRHDLPDLLARVAAARGIGPDAVPLFLEPTIKALMPDPSTLADMDVASERLAMAIRGKKRVAIFGDYDVDGATSAALLARFMKLNGVEPLIHIPDRITEGYGPNIGAIDALADAGATLLVTVDCGSTSLEAVEHARARGLDVVVIDHHQTGEHLPPALAVVNPNRQDDLSGQGHLAAVGVVFLVLVSLNRLLRNEGWYGVGRNGPDLLDWLDLVALGTIADVVPLAGLNRAYVRQGLKVMRRRECVGLSALADIARLAGPIDTYHLGFLLGPRINAGGRIGDCGLGVRLLLCEDRDEAVRISQTLDRLNAERQEIEKAVLQEALESAEAAGNPQDQAVLVAHSDADWHPGVVGLVAARLKERFQRPAFAIAFGADGLGAGSGRSIAGVDLGAAVRSAVDKGLIVKGGGHAMAAGLTVRRERLEEVTAFFEERLAEAVKAHSVSTLEIDGALTARAARVELVESLEKAGPFGSGSPEPVFALPAHRVAFAEATEQGHVRCAFSANDGGRLKAIAFRSADTPLGTALLSGRNAELHVAGILRIDRWGGRQEVCMHVRDVSVPSAG